MPRGVDTRHDPRRQVTRPAGGLPADHPLRAGADWAPPGATTNDIIRGQRLGSRDGIERARDMMAAKHGYEDYADRAEARVEGAGGRHDSARLED